MYISLYVYSQGLRTFECILDKEITIIFAVYDLLSVVAQSQCCAGNKSSQCPVFCSDITYITLYLATFFLLTTKAYIGLVCLLLWFWDLCFMLPKNFVHYYYFYFIIIITISIIIIMIRIHHGIFKPWHQISSSQFTTMYCCVASFPFILAHHKHETQLFRGEKWDTSVRLVHCGGGLEDSSTWELTCWAITGCTIFLQSWCIYVYLWCVFR